MNDSDVVELHIGVKGRFKLSVLKDGAIQRESGWFDNLITDLGMDQITNGASPFGYGQVGSSSSSPSFTDTSLGARIAGVAGPSLSRPVSFSIDATNRYVAHRFTYTFLAGAAAGNVAEVGVSNNLAGTQLTSHARVLDSGGSPTTITVLAGEDLVMVYEFQIKQPIGDFTALVSGKNVTIRSAMVNATAQGTLGTWYADPFLLQLYPGFNSAYTGSIGAITALPSGTAYSGATVANSAYTTGSWTRVGTITWPTSQANTAIKSFYWNFGYTAWQMEMDTTLTKNNTQTLRLGVRLTWSRDSGPA